jgi:uncharacterized membrane protein
MESTRALARRPPREPIRRLNFQERIAPSLWYTPGLFVIVAIVLSKLTVTIDRAIGAEQAPEWLLGADADAAAALTATVAAAMLSFVAVVFTTTLVAIQLAGGQYSPRVVRVFVRSRLTHVTLGLFLATFVFALNGLVEIRAGEPDELVPAITVSVVYLLLLATLAAFITFVHGMSKMLRVQYLLTHITEEGRRAIHAGFPTDDELIEVDVLALGTGTVLVSHGPVGVVQAIDRQRLVEVAVRSSTVIELMLEAGEYLGMGTPVARLLTKSDNPPTAQDVTDAFLLGAERTLVHDPGFVFRQTVDVAIRALSPAVNDPTTAVQAIDRMNDLLGDVSGRPDPSGWYVDGEGVARLHLREPSFERLMTLAYVEIIRYGADSPQVVRRLRAAFTVLEPQVRPDVLPALRALGSMLDAASTAALPAAFTEISGASDRHGLG